MDNSHGNTATPPSAKYVAVQHDSRQPCSGRGCELARMRLAPDGIEVALSDSADYSAFMAWLEQALVRR
ncbi:hypothetical protein ACXJJ3_00605 [Kribbella sp. WER1]